jgi:hypothetical protein
VAAGVAAAGAGLASDGREPCPGGRRWGRRAGTLIPGSGNILVPCSWQMTGSRRRVSRTGLVRDVPRWVARAWLPLPGRVQARNHLSCTVPRPPAERAAGPRCSTGAITSAGPRRVLRPGGHQRLIPAGWPCCGQERRPATSVLQRSSPAGSGYSSRAGRRMS